MKKFIAGFLLCLLLIGAGKLIAGHVNIVNHIQWGTESNTVESLDEIAYQLARIANSLEAGK